VRKILVGAARVRYDVQVAEIGPRYDQVVDDSATLGGEERQSRTVVWKPGDVGNDKALEELDAVPAGYRRLQHVRHVEDGDMLPASASVLAYLTPAFAHAAILRRRIADGNTINTHISYYFLETSN